MKTAAELVTQIIEARKSKSAGKKAAATRATNLYVTNRANERGCTETQVRAGILASITRRTNKK